MGGICAVAETEGMVIGSKNVSGEVSAGEFFVLLSTASSLIFGMKDAEYLRIPCII